MNSTTVGNPALPTFTTVQTESSMHLVFPVNQKQAIRRGFNAPSSFKFNLDVASLTQDERYALSLVFDSGRVGEELTIPEPTEAGVKEALGRFTREVDAFKDQLAQSFKRNDEKEVMGTMLVEFGWREEVRKEFSTRPDVKAWLAGLKKN